MLGYFYEFKNKAKRPAVFKCNKKKLSIYLPRSFGHFCSIPLQARMKELEDIACAELDISGEKIISKVRTTFVKLFSHG